MQDSRMLNLIIFDINFSYYIPQEMRTAIFLGLIFVAIAIYGGIDNTADDMLRFAFVCLCCFAILDALELINKLSKRK